MVDLTKKKWFVIQLVVFVTVIFAFTTITSLTCHKPFHGVCMTPNNIGWDRFIEYYLLLLSGPISGFYPSLSSGYGLNLFWVTYVLVAAAFSYGPLIVFIKVRKMGPLLLAISAMSWLLSAIFINITIWI